MADSTVLSDGAQKALHLFEEGCLPNRKAFIAKLRMRSEAYHGIVDARSNAKDWQSQLYPPFVGHIIESTLAAVVDGKLSYRIKPRPRFFDPDEYRRVQDGAKAHTILMDAQLAADRFSETQQPFALQDAIYGLTVMKTRWERDVRVKPELKVVPDEGAAELGVFLPRLVESEGVRVCYDGPTSEVVNVEDFFWHEAAVTLEKAPVIAHRVWASFSDLKRLEQQGVYRNVDELRDAADQSDDYTQYRVIDGTSRSRDMIEVLEIWWQEPDGIHTVTLGNRAVELAQPRRNPFWHGEVPFDVGSTRPNLFSIAGKSQVEKIAALQEAHWDIGNQLLDNLRLLNNAIFMLSDDIPDPDALEFAPGAQWLVDGDPNEMVKSWTPNPISAELAVPHLSRLEQMMQNLAGGYPFTSTAEAGTANADTATQAALVSNIAQQATAALKQQLAYAYGRIGQKRVELNQQFLRTSIMVEQVGLDTAQELVEIAPFLLQGDFLFDISPMVDSLMRSERRSEANSMFQTFLQAAPLWLELTQAGAATPLNADEFLRQWLESWDVGDTSQFFSARPQPVEPVPGTQPAAATEPSAPGITAPQAIDPSVSPSAQASLSPETHLQRLGAMRGGVSNT